MLSHKTKRRIADVAVWIGIFLCCSVLACALAFPAYAQEVGVGLICDTADQAEAFVAVAEVDDTDAALQQVNAEHNVCVIAQVAFIRGDEVKTLTVKHGVAHITAIAVIGIVNGGQLISVPPSVQFTVFLEKKETL
jgi:hypothetical protein